MTLKPKPKVIQVILIDYPTCQELYSLDGGFICTLNKPADAALEAQFLSDEKK